MTSTRRSADCADVMALQETLNDAVGALLQFYQGKVSADEVLASVTAGMEGAGVPSRKRQEARPAGA